MARKSRTEPLLRRSLRGRGAAGDADGAPSDVQTQAQTKAKASPSRSINARARVTTPRGATKPPSKSSTTQRAAAATASVITTAAVSPPTPPASATIIADGAPPADTSTAGSDTLTAADKGYVKTCQNCCHLKIRCIRSIPGDSSPPPCDRCRRLNRQCIYRPARRRFNHALHGRDDHIRVLEARIEELTTTASQPPEPPTAPPSSVLPPSLPASASPIYQQEDIPEIQMGESDSHVDTQSAPQSVRSHPDVIDELLSPERAQHLLDIYISSMAIHFPFVIIHPALTFEQLRRSKPFLSLAIAAAACFQDIALQRSLGLALKQTASNLLASAEELTLEVLQGLLVFLAWSHYQPRPSRYSQFLQMAIGIIADLRLDRMQGPAGRTYPGRDATNGSAAHVRGLTLDEMRAVAGCCYLSSTTSHLLQKFNPFPWTNHVRECCDRLRSACEYESDEYLYHVMELQHLVEQIEPSSHGAASTNPSAASHFEIMSRLDQIGQLVTLEMQHVEMLVIQYHTAQLFLSQASLPDRNVPVDPSILSQLTSSGLSYAKYLLNFYLSLPLHAEALFNTVEWMQLSFALTAAARLSVAAKRDAQSAAMAPSNNGLSPELHLTDMLRHINLRIGALSNGQDYAGGSGDTCRGFQQRVQRMLGWFEQVSASASPEEANSSTAAAQDPSLGASLYSQGSMANGGHPITPAQQIPYQFQEPDGHAAPAEFYATIAPGAMRIGAENSSSGIQGEDMFSELDDILGNWWSEVDPSLTF